jgi:hypothetical protein
MGGVSPLDVAGGECAGAEAGAPVRYSLGADAVSPRDHGRDLRSAHEEGRREAAVAGRQDGDDQQLHRPRDRHRSGADARALPDAARRRSVVQGPARADAPRLPELRDKVRDARSRDADNTILHKKFHGGHLTIVGSNSAADLSARPIRDVLVDEVDRCAKSAGTEGDPIRLAFRARRRSAAARSAHLVTDARRQRASMRIPARHAGGA